MKTSIYKSTLGNSWFYCFIHSGEGVIFFSPDRYRGTLGSVIDCTRWFRLWFLTVLAWSVLLPSAPVSAQSLEQATDWSPLHCRAGSRATHSYVKTTLSLKSKGERWELGEQSWLSRTRHRWLRSLYAAQTRDSGAWHTTMIPEMPLAARESGVTTYPWSAEDRTCVSSPGIASLVTPRRPVTGDDVRVLLASETPLANAFVVVSHDTEETISPCGIDLIRGPLVQKKLRYNQSGPPYWGVVSFKVPAAGDYHVSLINEGRISHCTGVTAAERRRFRPKGEGVWLTEREWTAGDESLFAAWIEHMFHDDAPMFWDSLHDVTRDKSRNLLHNHLSRHEDSRTHRAALRMTPDCADNPLFLRAYFAWKLGLPFGFHSCRVAGRGRAGQCQPQAIIRHILIRLPKGASQKKSTAAMERLQLARQAVAAGQSFAEVAKAHSECFSKTAGGYLGVVGPGELFPELESYALALEEEVISEPIRTQYGYHLVWVVEKRDWVSNESTFGDERPNFQRFLNLMKQSVRSSGLRTQLTSDWSDLYPVDLSRDTLRPGTVFADPYGHVLMVARWVPQKGKEPGRMLAVDAQPDGTVAIKRFWKGNFVFRTEGLSAGPGFKVFRPIVRDLDESLRAVTNSEIAQLQGYPKFSLQQKDMPAPQFYDTLELLINTEPLDPVEAYRDVHRAFWSQVRHRIRAVNVAQKYWRKHPRNEIRMPAGKGIFQTAGPWEALSTPCRDMRLLIALDAVTEFPSRLIRNPDAFVVPPNRSSDSLREELVVRGKRWRLRKTVNYLGSNGVEQSLSLEDIVTRASGFEMAYNPNDCPEIRWSAPEGSEERIRCNRKASEKQRQQMKRLRHWFQQRYGCG